MRRINSERQLYRGITSRASDLQGPDGNSTAQKYVNEIDAKECLKL